MLQLIFRLSINKEDLKKHKGKKVISDFIIKKNDLVKNFEQARTHNYREILQNEQFDLRTARNVIQLAIEFKS